MSGINWDDYFDFSEIAAAYKAYDINAFIKELEDVVEHGGDTFLFIDANIAKMILAALKGD